jgi:tRNA dimethylallyltransferase
MTMAAAERPVLQVLTGPTAVGKTELALQWAERFGAEIVSCDSLLFYRGMDIGTAKPTVAERARVPHHLIDLCAVDEAMNISRYVELARAAVAGIHERGRRVLVTGGSGFYLRAFFAPVADEVVVPPALRREIENRWEREGLEPLVAELRALNGGDLGTLDVANPRRVLRALERCRASGCTLRALREAFAARPGAFANWAVSCVRLDREPADLGRRIEQRVAQMLAGGLIEEVERLAATGLRNNPSAARAIGYRETLAVLDGRMARADLAAAMVQNTRALVRKQRTWFRTQLPAHRVVAADEADVATLFAP